MFDSDYQGGPCVEVFTAQSKESYSLWKFASGQNGEHLKTFDHEVKSFVFALEGSNVSAKLQTKEKLTLIQRFLVMQVIIPKNKDFCLELGVHDHRDSKRRITLSTNNKAINITPNHTRLPLGIVKRSEWMNLVLDMVSLVSDAWKGQTFESLKSVCISGNCRLRRIFTMKSQLFDTTDDEELYGCKGTNGNVEIDSLPRQYAATNNSIQLTQVLNFDKITHYNSMALETPVRPETELDLNSSRDGRRKTGDQSHIAFGSKVSAQSQPKASRESSAHQSKPRENSAHKGNSSRDGSNQKVHSAREHSSHKRDGSSHRGTHRDGSSHRSTANRDQRGTSSREGSAQKGSSRESSAQKASSRENSAQKGGYSSREGSAKKTASREDLSYKGGGSRESSAQSSREGSGHSRTAINRDHVSTSSRAHHSRSKSDTDRITTTRKIQPHRSKHALQKPTIPPVATPRDQSHEEARDRRDSDPGTLMDDPEVTVDKESLRSSHTWTDGADGVVEIPYVRPHPPSEPSSAKHRRPRPVRSAGKERTPHAGHVVYKDEGRRPPRSQITNENEGPDILIAPPTQIANDDEEAEILRAMEESYRRSMQRGHGSTTTSDDNSYGRGDDVMRAIQVLNNRPPAGRSDTNCDTSDTTTGSRHEYDESDEYNSSQGKGNKVYTYASKPRHIKLNGEEQNRRHVSKTRHTKDRKRSSDMDSEVTLNSIGHQESKIHSRRTSKDKESVRGERNKRQSQNDRARENISINNPHSSSSQSAKDTHRNHANGDSNGTAAMTSQIRHHRRAHVMDALSAPSSEEEPQMSQSRQHHRKQRSPRHKSLKPRNGASKTQSQYRPHRGDGDAGPENRFDHANPAATYALPEASTPSGIHLRVPGSPLIDGADESVRARTPMSISRKSLREIPGPSDEMRKSGGSRPYNPVHYQNGPEQQQLNGGGAEMYDSAELQYLRNIRRGEERSDDDDDDVSDDESTSQTDDNESDHTQKNTAEFRGSMSQFRYRNDSESGEEMGTTSSTLKHSIPREPYSYQAEMEMMRSQGDEFLTASNPRIWGQVLSPPIPDTTPPVSANLHSRQKVGVHFEEKYQQNGYADSGQGTSHTDEEEELDLLYDPVLNCYYDPKTYKYYELV